MTIKKITYECSCHECSKTNYFGTLSNHYGLVDDLFEIQMTNHRINICKDCLTSFVETAVAALNEEE